MLAIGGHLEGLASGPPRPGTRHAQQSPDHAVRAVVKVAYPVSGPGMRFDSRLARRAKSESGFQPSSWSPLFGSGLRWGYAAPDFSGPTRGSGPALREMGGIVGDVNELPEVVLVEGDAEPEDRQRR